MKNEKYLDKYNHLSIYDSKLNTQPFTDFLSKELDVFFAILSKFKNTKSYIAKFETKELRDMSEFNTHTSLNDFIEYVEGTYKKILGLQLQMDIDYKDLSIESRQNFPEQSGTVYFNLFSDFFISEDKKTIIFELNRKYEFLVNDLTRYTIIELRDFIRLKSEYSKNAYRLFKQFHYLSSKEPEKTIATVYLPINKMKSLLSIPDHYGASTIGQKVLKPIMNELPEIFEGLSVEKKKGTGKDSRKIVQYNFRFKKIKMGSRWADLDEIEKNKLKDYKINDNKNDRAYNAIEEKIKKDQTNMF